MTLELDGLTHCYGDEVAVEDVSFGIDAGEIVGLLGPSGCGKTTIVQAIAGHVNPTDGGVRLRGRDVTDNPPETRDVGIVFQEPTLFPHMTVEENVAYGLKPQDIDPAERSETVERYLELVSLGDQREAFPSALSGGQKRRVELARALAPEPDLLLLDEPLSALDRALRERLRKEIARIQRETGVATLYVTHDQETAMGLADRLVVVTEGQVAGVGEPRDLYESPSSPFVAAFLGGSNRLPVTVDANGEFTVESHALAVDGGDRPGEGAITCLTRPENITLRGPDTTGSDVCLPGVVTRVADFGKRYEIIVDLETGDELTVEQRAKPPSTGSRVTANVDAEDVMIFEEP
ncbi:MAG: ABC transporter ATP-binding protein [Halapricum sp.]